MNKLAPGLLADAGGRLTRAALIVAGMHRSGTSALARTMSLLGADLPQTLMRPGADNPKGFWESAVFADANDKVLQDLNSSWDDALSLLVRRREMSTHPGAIHRIRSAIASEFSGEGSTVVVKEPRIALLLDLWLHAFAAEGFSTRVVVPVRNPLEVSASLAARNGFAVGRSLLLWLTYFLSAERASRSSRRVFVSYPDLLQDWRSVLGRVESSLGIAFSGWNPTAELEVDNFLSSDDRHQVASIEQLNVRGDVVDWVKRAYQWSLEAAIPGAAPDCALLDEIASEFEASLRVFAPVIADQQADLRAEKKIASQLRTDIEQRDAAIGDLRSGVEQHQATIVALQGEIEQARASIGSLEQSLGDRNTVIVQLRNQLQALEQSALEQASQLSANKREGEALAAQIVVLQNSVDEMLRDSEARQGRILTLQAKLVEGERALLEHQQKSAELQRELTVRERQAIAALEAQRRAEAERNATASAHVALEAQRRAQIEQQQKEIARLKEIQLADAEHLRALEQSARSAREHAEAEAGERRGLETVARSQKEFIESSIPAGRRLRGALWRRPWLRPASYVLEFARLAPARGLRRAAKIVWSAISLRRAGVFDEHFYLEQAWDVRALGQDPVIHYVAIGASEGRDPSSSFSTSAYLRQYPDVAGSGANPLFHYMRHGRKEGRVASKDAVSDNRLGGEAVNIAADSVNPYSVRPDEIVSMEARRGSAFMERFDLLGEAPDWAGAVAALNANDVARSNGFSAPDVSIIIPVYGQLAYTLNCLHSVLSHESSYSVEVIVVDDCSPDASRDWIARVRGVTLHKRSQNGGFIAACNDGAEQAQGQWLVFLNNDTRVVAGWLDSLIQSFTSLVDAELVGSKLFYPDGSLQEAGGIIWRDGSAWNYGRNDDPGKPEYCYARPVDYVSGASIAIARSVWGEIGGFDTRYTPAYGEDSDLALKVRYARQKQVYLQPLSRVIHYEGKTSGTDVTQGAKAYQISNAATLYETWRQPLSAHRENGLVPALEKDRGVRKRALVIDATTPEPDKDAGSLTCFELMRALQKSGYGVSFAAENLLYLANATAQLQRVGIEALYYPYQQNLEHALRERGGDFDIVLVFRLDVADRYLDVIRRYCPRAKIIFHCSDLHFLRAERQAALNADAAALASAQKTKQRELAVVSSVDAAIVHSTYEKDLLTELAPSANVAVFPWILEPVPSDIPFRARRDIAFLGGYRHTPNVDAVKYFVERIWPLIHAKRRDLKFIVAGSECPDELLALNGRDNIEVVGFVGDLKEFFGKLRLSVAPIRYGAGIKGKVAMSLAHGVPTLVTSCAAEGMELRNGDAVIICDDEAAFAEALLKLYDDEERWTRMSERALNFVEAAYGGATARRKVREMLELAGVSSE